VHDDGPLNHLEIWEVDMVIAIMFFTVAAGLFGLSLVL
jgi:hypothetical protein